MIFLLKVIYYKYLIKLSFVNALLKNYNIVMPSAYIDINTDLGKYIYVGYNTFITKSCIGNYTSIANNASIGLGEHDIKKISTSSLFYNNQYKELTRKKVVIGNDVWIGADSIIRRGVTIGNGAVIGANSFVNKDIPEFAIAVGSPAKIIKYRFTKNKIAKIKKTKWWIYDIQKAKKIITQLEIKNNAKN